MFRGEPHIQRPLENFGIRAQLPNGPGPVLPFIIFAMNIISRSEIDINIGLIFGRITKGNKLKKRQKTYKNNRAYMRVFTK